MFVTFVLHLRLKNNEKLISDHIKKINSVTTGYLASIFGLLIIDYISYIN